MNFYRGAFPVRAIRLGQDHSSIGAILDPETEYKSMNLTSKGGGGKLHRVRPCPRAFRMATSLLQGRESLLWS